MKVLIYDLEVSPVLGWAYSKYDTNLIAVEHDYFLLSFAYKWLGQKSIHVHALPDYKTYEKDPWNDRELCEEFFKIRDQADTVLGHNMGRFDEKKANTRLVMNGFRAPVRANIIDTLTLARSRFAFTGNALHDLCHHLDLPYKKMSMDKDLWIQCIKGDLKAWEYEKKYNKRDIQVTEDVYLKVRSYMHTHPNMNAEDGLLACHACKSTNLAPKGYRILMSGMKKRRYRCKDCGTLTCERRGDNITLLR